MVGISAPNSRVHLDRLVGDLLDEVGAPVPLVARRVERRRRRPAAPGAASAPTPCISGSGTASSSGAIAFAPRPPRRRRSTRRRRTPCAGASPRGTAAPGGTVWKAKKPLSSRGALGQELAVGREHLGGLLDRPERRAADDGADLVQAEQERRDDAEVAAAAADRPEQVGVLVGARAHALAVREHDLGLEQVVDRQPALARQVAEAAAERQPADAGGRDDPARRREAVLVGGARRPRPRCSRRRRGRCAPAGSTSMSLQQREVDDDAVVARCPSPAPLWPPPRTASSRSWSRAKPTALATSSAVAQRAISAGRLSIIAL